MLTPPASAVALVVTLGALAASLGGCPPEESVTIPNSTDPTNKSARYVGASACRNCHSDVGEWTALHAHSHTLTAVRGAAPSFPEGTSAGVGAPPEGLAWADIAYVLDGFTTGARYLDQRGFILTTGSTGGAAQWDLAQPALGNAAGLVDYAADVAAPIAYDFDRLRGETTGAVAQDPENPESQENRPGIEGTWNEPGVQCEACHGPGSGHFNSRFGQVSIDLSRIYVDLDGGDSCRACHTQPYGDETGAIAARDGFIEHRAQWPELRASGGHRNFTCTTCHDPHRSTTYDRANAIRNECTACHTDQNMAGHRGFVFTRPDGYTEALSCESCHMPYAALKATTGTPAVFGDAARVGDTRSHIFRISADPAGAASMFTADGSQVVRDSDGRAAVTVDFVCLRCHNGNGIFELRLDRAAEIAPRLHDFPE